MNQNQYKQIMWDYNLKLADFRQILSGQKKLGWFNQDWAIGRVLEHLPYYQVKKLLPLDILTRHWNKVKSRLYNQTIRKGYEFVLRQHALSTPR